MKYLILVLITSVSVPLFAETIEFSDDELATESVLPVFDRKGVVKNRVVTLKKRYELGAGLGLNMTEAIYDNKIFNLSGAYHFDEVHGVNLSATFMTPGLSANGKALKNGEIAKSNLEFHADKAPSPEYSLFANYQATAYYGKISLSKEFVMNLSLYGLLGLGTVSFGDSNSIGLDVGFGQKLYFTDNLALRFDVRLLAYQGPDPTDRKGAIKTIQSSDPDLKSSDFETTTYYHTHRTLGLVYLL